MLINIPECRDGGTHLGHLHLWQQCPRRTQVCQERAPPRSCVGQFSGPRWCPWSAPARPGWNTAGRGSFLCLWGSPKCHLPSLLERNKRVVWGFSRTGLGAVLHVLCQGANTSGSPTKEHPHRRSYQPVGPSNLLNEAQSKTQSQPSHLFSTGIQFTTLRTIGVCHTSEKNPWKYEKLLKNQPRKWLPDNRVPVSFRIKFISHISLGKELCQHLQHLVLLDVTILKCVTMLQIGKKQQLSSSVWKEFIQVTNSQHFEFNERRHQAGIVIQRNAEPGGKPKFPQ